MLPPNDSSKEERGRNNIHHRVPTSILVPVHRSTPMKERQKVAREDHANQFEAHLRRLIAVDGRSRNRRRPSARTVHSGIYGRTNGHDCQGK